MLGQSALLLGPLVALVVSLVATLRGSDRAFALSGLAISVLEALALAILLVSAL